ncbi:MAG: hypothetical protein CL534_03210 [Ahrensia sp.]|nr:hypothetical protein [Ahrensia sp.]
MAARKKPKPTEEPETRVVNRGEILKTATLATDKDMQLQRIREISDVVYVRHDLSESEIEAKVGAALETLAEIAPRDGVERMLAVQMIGCHEAATESLRLAARPDQTYEGRDQCLKHASKLMATYANLLGTLNKMRGNNHQIVTVEHVHIDAAKKRGRKRTEHGGIGHNSGMRTPLPDDEE